MYYETLFSAIQVVGFAILVCAAIEDIRLRRRLAMLYTVFHICKQRIYSCTRFIQRTRFIMVCDELIDELLAADSPEPNIVAGNIYSEAIGDLAAASSAAESVAVASDRKRERLAALTAGGHAKQYIGKTISAYQIDSTSDAEIERSYARLGAAMTKMLGQAVLQ